MAPVSGYFDTVFAASGDVTAVPDAAPGDGSVSYTTGYGIAYSTAVASGGLNFPRAQHNQILKDVTTAIQFIQQNGMSNFITTVMNGGSTPYSYNQGALGMYNAGSGTQGWLSLVGANTGTPGSSANWVPIGSITPNTQTGNSYAPQASDATKVITRSNATVAMTDTLPGTSGALASGWFAYYNNTDTSAAISMGVGSGGTIRVGNQATANAFVVEPGELWFVLSEGSGAYTAGRVAAASLHTRPAQGARNKLVGNWVSNTTATYTANSIVVKDSNNNTYTLSSFNKTLNTATTGIGGLSTGSLAASTWYAVYSAFNPASNTQGIFFDPSFTAPTLPTGYPAYALMGAIRTDGSSNLIGFTQLGDEWQYVTGQNLSAYPTIINGNSTYSTPISISTFYPSIASRIYGSVAFEVNSPVSLGSNSSYAQYGWDSGTGPTFSTDINPWSLVLESTNIYFGAGNGGILRAIACKLQI